jgi:hypothetical protein
MVMCVCVCDKKVLKEEERKIILKKGHTISKTGLN